MTIKFEELKGKTLISAEVSEDKDELVFVDTDGFKYTMLHAQECCERVYVEDICGDLEDILGGEILYAVEASSETTDAAIQAHGDYVEWTFYKIDTKKGGVVIRWIGESNGHYSMGVSLIKEKTA